MALPGKFKAKKRKGKKKAPFSIWTVLGWFCITSNEPIKNEISDNGLVFWLFFFYLVCGSAYYFFSSPYRASLTFADTVYFLVTTMTTVGYGDIVPPSDPAARLWTLLFVVWGLVVTLAGLNELAAYILEMRERIMESMRAAVLSGKSSGGQGGGGAEATTSTNPLEGGGGADDDEIVSRLKRRSQTRLASLESFETELAKQGVTGWRAHLAFAANLPSLARKRFPVIDIVLWLAAYCAFWGWLYSSVEENMTFVDAVYLAMVTGTTVRGGACKTRTFASYAQPFLTARSLSLCLSVSLYLPRVGPGRVRRREPQKRCRPLARAGLLALRRGLRGHPIGGHWRSVQRVRRRGRARQVNGARLKRGGERHTDTGNPLRNGALLRVCRNKSCSGFSCPF
jgi:hypothetical protein